METASGECGISGGAIVADVEATSIGDLANSRPLDVHRWSDFPGVGSVLDDIFAQLLESPCRRLADLRLARDKVRRALREHLRVVLLDLCIAWWENRDEANLAIALGRPFIAYSRNKNSFAPGTRYASVHLKYPYLIAAIDALADKGLIEHHMGFYDRRTRFGRQARMRATAQLMEMVNRQRLERGHVSRQHPMLVLRNALGQEVPLPATQEVERMRADVSRINAMLLTAKVSLHLTREERIELMAKGSIDTTRNTLYRVFNVSLAGGGRFYGLWCQNIPREYRARLRMAGNRVVEFDFVSLHPRLLYAQGGALPPVGDLYSLDGINEYYRPAIKVLVNTLINATTERAAVNSAMFNDSDGPSLASQFWLTRRNIEMLVEKIKRRHAPIASQFGSGAGLQLQRVDSDMARDIMLGLVSRGIHCLPIHDSFIVAEHHALALEEVMSAVSLEQVGVPLPVERKTVHKTDKRECSGFMVPPPLVLI